MHKTEKWGTSLDHMRITRLATLVFFPRMLLLEYTNSSIAKKRYFDTAPYIGTYIKYKVETRIFAVAWSHGGKRAMAREWSCSLC